MKKSFLFITLTGLIALASCNKEAGSSAGPSVNPNLKTEVTIRIKGDVTRAEQTASEEAINSLQVLAFRNGGIESYASVSGVNSVTFTTTSGTKSVYAVVNAPDLSSIADETTLKATVSALSDNSAASFVMVGQKSITFAATNPTPFTVSVSRLAARVEIDRIVNDLTNPVLAGLDFKIQKIYLADVAASDRLVDDYSPVAADFIHHSGAMQTSNAFIYKSIGSGVIAKGTGASDGYNVVNNFYAYQNPQSVYVTKLVVEVQLGTDYYTYPVVIADGSAILSNRLYRISELRITRLGNDANGDDVIDDGETDPITVASATVDLDVADWSVVLVNGDGKVVI